MRLFTCSHCHNPLYFENSYCLKCNHSVGFDFSTLTLVTLEPESKPNYYTDIKNKQQHYHYCLNAEYGACNWLVQTPEPSLCKACELNTTIPDLTIPANIDNWRSIEAAKHRLVFSLLKLKLPFDSKRINAQMGLAFAFMEDSPNQKVFTGHENGVITLNILEANEVERIRHKADLGEPYRTLLGHLRHEIGHYYWDLLISNTDWLPKFRALFGDDSLDYSIALQNYYNGVPPVNWNQNFISMYSTAHAWEDWAETFAHYLHMMDTLETAYSFGLAVDPIIGEKEMEAEYGRDPYKITSFDKILKMWMPLTFALNSLNRSMGHQDFYPFVISPAVEKKLAFIHSVCSQKRFSNTLASLVGIN